LSIFFFKAPAARHFIRRSGQLGNRERRRRITAYEVRNWVLQSPLGFGRAKRSLLSVIFARMTREAAWDAWSPRKYPLGIVGFGREGKIEKAFESFRIPDCLFFGRA
jgi:hypothetical protein